MMNCTIIGFIPLNKKEQLKPDFSKRIAILDKKGLKKINLLEKRTRLCDKNMINKFQMLCTRITISSRIDQRFHVCSKT